MLVGILLLLVLSFSFSFICYDDSLTDKAFLVILNKENTILDLKYLSDRFAFLKRYNVGFIVDNNTLVLLNYTTNADNVLLFCSFYPNSFIYNLSCCINKNVCVREKDLKYMVGFKKIPYFLIFSGRIHCRKEEGLMYEDKVPFKPYYYNKTGDFELIIKPISKLSSKLVIKIYRRENIASTLSSVEKLLNSLGMNTTLKVNYFKKFYYYSCECFPTNESKTKKILKILSLFTSLNINDLKDIVTVAKSCRYPYFIFYFHGKWMCSKKFYQSIPFRECSISMKKIFFEGKKEISKKYIEKKVKSFEETKKKIRVDMFLIFLSVLLILLFKVFPRFRLF